ncbi:MAG: hypothetical protein ACO2ZK_09375 [Gemmobacter sp.]
MYHLHAIDGGAHLWTGPTVGAAHRARMRLPDPLAAEVYHGDRRVVWYPQGRSAARFLTSTAFEALYHGGRGCQKTDTLIFDFLRDVGRGYGRHWRGLLIRERAKGLEEVIERLDYYVPQMWPGAIFRASGGKKPVMYWEFPSGETLQIAHACHPRQYADHHGGQKTWLGVDEATNQPTAELYRRLLSTLRSRGHVACGARLTTNPGGVGNAWVKKRFIAPAAPGQVFRVQAPHLFGGGLETSRTRQAIAGKLEENEIFLAANPQYRQTILSSVADNPDLYKAWDQGSWDINAGGRFSEVWTDLLDANGQQRAACQGSAVVRPFDIPRDWVIRRSHDWGSRSPSATVWVAEARGEVVPGVGKIPAGSLVAVAEYVTEDPNAPGTGTQATSREIAREIKRIEAEHFALKGRHVEPGPADQQLWSTLDERTIHDGFQAEGVTFRPAKQGPGSRATGAVIVADMLKSSRDNGDAPRAYFFSGCRRLVDTIPQLARSETKPDEVAKPQNDHPYDAYRYAAQTPRRDGWAEPMQPVM